MISVTDVYKKAIQNDQRDWREKLLITLNDPSHASTVLTVTNENLWSGGFTIEDAVSADNVYQVGGAIVNKATFVLNNIYGTYTEYDFTLAEVTAKIGLAVEVDLDEDILPDPASGNGWVNGYVSTDGAMASQTDKKEMTSPFIKVKGGRNYTLSYQYTQAPAGQAWTCFSCYDKDKNFIANYSAETSSTGLIEYSQTLNLDVEYIRVSLRTYDLINVSTAPIFALNETDTQRYYTKGKFIVNSATYNGSLITLECYDYMCKFDFPYFSTVTWPATPNYIIRNACNLCGVTYANTSFPNQSAIRLPEPEGDKLTFRDVISYVAQICGCYARCNTNGELQLSWYDQDTLDKTSKGVPEWSSTSTYSVGDIVRHDGSIWESIANNNTRTPSTSATNYWTMLSVHCIDSMYSKDITGIDIAPTMISITYSANPEEPDYTASVRIPAWSSSSTYSTGDLVRRSNRIWKSKTDNNTTPPTTSATDAWSIVTDNINTYKTPIDAWASENTPYAKGAVVRQADKVYQSLANNNIQTPTPNASKWKYISEYTVGYVIEIEGNPFTKEENVDTILDWLGASLLGHYFRRASLTHGSDPSIEAGDVAIVIMPDGQTCYPIHVSKTTFNTGSAQATVSAAEAPLRNESTRYSNTTKSINSISKIVRQQFSSRDAAYADLVHALSDYSGLYMTTEPDEVNGGDMYYLHDQQTLEGSTNVWKITAGGWGVSTDGGQTWNAGITAYGVMVANLISATGILFDWAEGGTLTLGGSGNGNGILVIKDSSNREAARINSSRFRIGSSNSDGLYFDLGEKELVVFPDATPYLGIVAEKHVLASNGFSFYLSATGESASRIYRLRTGYDGIHFERSTNSGSTFSKLGSIEIETDDEDKVTGHLVASGNLDLAKTSFATSAAISRSSIKVNSMGTVKLNSGNSPTGSEANFRYQCYGSDAQKTLIVSNTSNRTWVCHYASSTWTSWKELDWRSS